MKQIDMNVQEMVSCLTEEELLLLIGQIAGVCYNSSLDKDKCFNRALNCIKRGHHSPWEHYNISLRCTVDRGVSHALVRHRHCVFQQSSTIYQKFNELIIIAKDYTEDELNIFKNVESGYLRLVASKQPSEARDLLPNATATDLIITTNIRQWMYMLQRRTGPGDSDNMHKWSNLVRQWFEVHYPKTIAAFDLWYEKHPL